MIKNQFNMDKSQMNYIRVGNGETTLVFLHFFGGSINSWTGVINQLKTDFTCVAIDLLGFGNSPKPKKELSVNDHAEDVIDLIQDLNIENYILIGHSMGGKITLAIAAKNPAGLRSLLLVAPSPPTPEPTTNKDRMTMLETFGSPYLIERLINGITAKPLSPKTLNETIKEHLQISKIAWDGWITNGSQEDITFLMPHIKVPLKIISGVSDPNFSTDFLKKEFAKYFPTAIFESLKDTGHLIPIEVPTKLIDSIKSFI